MVPNPVKREEKPAPKPPELPPIVRLLQLAQEWQRRLDAGEFRTRAELAQYTGLGPVRVSTILGLLRLHPAILAHIEGLPPGTPPLYLTERWLRPVTRLAHAEQLRAVSTRFDLKPLTTAVSAPVPRRR